MTTHTTQPAVRSHDIDVRIFVARAPGIALADDEKIASLWIAAALDLADGRAAGLGLYDRLPSYEEIGGLIDAGEAGEGALGTQWACPEPATVTTDHALLWSKRETLAALHARGIQLRAAAPAGEDSRHALALFEKASASLCKFLKRQAYGRDAEGRSIISAQVAAKAALDWRDAQEGKAADPSRQPHSV